VLRRIFGPKREEVTGDWRKLHNEELRILYYAKYYYGDEIKKDKGGWHRIRKELKNKRTLKLGKEFRLLY